MRQPGGMQAGTERARLGTGPGKTQQGRALPKKRRGAALPGLWASARRGPKEQLRGTRPVNHSRGRRCALLPERRPPSLSARAVASPETN